MCPLWPFHLLFMYGSLLLSLWMLSSCVVATVADKMGPWVVHFDPAEVLLQMDSTSTVKFSTSLQQQEIDVGVVRVTTSDGNVANPYPSDKTYVLKTENISDFDYWRSAFNVTGNFLGYAEMHLQLVNSSDNTVLKHSNPVNVKVVRSQGLIDHLFTYSVAVLVSVIYINFGCALDWSVLRETIRRPVGPAIGFFSQFLCMPLISFGLAKWLFPGSIPMQLGIFFTGVSPAGGASNIWTYILGGNLSLSITMTTISTFAAFAMMPLWIFTLGHLIFQEGNLGVPYSQIGTFAIALVIPLAIGFLIQKYLPRVTNIMVRILKPFSALLIVFIVIFAIVTNLYLFELFTWKILVAGLGLPWLGYFLGWLLAHLFKQRSNDVLAISIEAGIQNTGIAIFLLRFSLGQPEADLTTVVPVAVAVLTPVPLMLLYIYQKCSARWIEKNGEPLSSETDDNIPSTASTSVTRHYPIGTGNIQ